MAEERWSRLTRAIAPVLEKIAARPLSDEERDLLEGIVEDHGLGGETTPEWMVGLFDDVLNRRVDRPGRSVPTEYPQGENGLANILHDIEAWLLPLGRDDYGEEVDWPIPSCGVRVRVSRETQDARTWIQVQAC